MIPACPDDSWNQGDPYERYIGRWSLLVADALLDWLDPAPGLRWLDVGCGTGAVCAAIRDQCAPAELTGIDPSQGFLATARTRLPTDATFRIGDAMHIPCESAQFDVIVSALVLNFVASPLSAVREMRRTASNGATIAAYVWDYSGGMALIRHFWAAAIELDGRAAALDEGQRFPLCQAGALESLFAKAGLSDVFGAPIDIATHFVDFDDYWSPFLGAQGPAPAYAMSLDESARNRLRDRIQQRLPTASNGSISLGARAWAARGRVSK
ncbi:MAG: class I SAM-dependent methyltransferase [Casimicrobiaceae bacterium]